MAKPLRQISWALVVTALAPAARAQVGDPQLLTDHPYYPGEGAMSTPARAVKLAMDTPRGTLGTGNDRDKLIRLFLWRIEHFAHAISPAVYNMPGKKPNPSGDDPLMTDYDGMRGLFSYGFGLCGTNHAQMRPFAEAMGWKDRRRGLQGDTGYEIQVDGKFRYFNTDGYSLHFLENSPTAHFAGIDEVITTKHRYLEWNPDIGLGYPMAQLNTHGNYQDFNGVTGVIKNRSLQWRDYYMNVWNIAPANSWKMYFEGYAGTPIVVRVKRGERFVRYFDQTGVVGEMGLAGPVWWGFNTGSGGPAPEFSFVQNAPARDQPQGGAEVSKATTRYGNVLFDWQPSLAKSEHLDGTVEIVGKLMGGGTPALKAMGAAKLVLEHFTPYTIGGRPADGKDPAGPSSDGALVYADATGTVDVEVSINGGMSWTKVGTLSGMGANVDFTELVKGRNGYLVRLSFDDGEGLQALRLRTIGMLNPGVYPDLKDGQAQVKYSAGNAGALDLSPDLWTAAAAESTTGYVQRTGLTNLNAVYFGNGSTFAYEGSQTGSVLYKVTLPPQLAANGAKLKEIFAAANFSVGLPPSPGTFGQIEVAASDAGPWTPIGRADVPMDDELSSGWVYGSSGAAALGASTAFVRYSSNNGGRPPRLRFLRLYATYSVPAPSTPVLVTYVWNNGADRMDAHMVAAGAANDAWTIQTGTGVKQRKVVIQALSSDGSMRNWDGGVQPPADAARVADAGSGGGGAGGSGTTGTRDGGTGSGGAGGGASGGGAGAGGSPRGGGGEPGEAADGGTRVAKSAGGCSCRTGGGDARPAPLLVAALLVSGWRRRRPKTR
jgi:MYXO-CTERM domain-containing protein